MCDLRGAYSIEPAERTDWLEQQQQAFLFRDPDGGLQAFFLLREDVAVVDGATIVFVTVNSFFARNAARGSPALPRAVLRYVGSLLLRFPRARRYAVGLFVTPNSWRWLRGGMARVFTPQSRDLGCLERKLLDAYCARLRARGWQPDRRVFDYPAVRPGVQDSALRRGETWQQEYEALRERPTDALLCMGELSARNLWPLVKRWLRRSRTFRSRRGATGASCN